VKKLVIAALAATQVMAGQPALAAALDAGTQTRVGVFAGAQVRIPLGGCGPRAQAPTAALGIAPIANSQRPTGETQMRIGDGLQLRLQPDRPVELAFAGNRLDQFRLARGGQTPDGPRSGVSTLGWIGIGVGVVAVGFAGFAWWLAEESECGPSEC
jgi:hypothetical protein